jgi:multidrug efflux system membrane fusion protein
MGRLYACGMMAGLLTAAACNQAKSEPKPLAAVRVAQVQTIKTGNEVRYSASIIPYSQVDLSFKSPGYIESIRQVRGTDGGLRNIDAGDFVTRGTVLAVVQQQDYMDKLAQARAQADRAQADYEKAKLSFDRVNVLYSNQSATKPDYDSAKAQLDSASAAVSGARASISEAEVALAYCTLRAPFDGSIVKRSVDIGSLVGPATNGFTLADTHLVKAVFGVPDVSMSRVRLGQKQTITNDALLETFEGRISSISPAADPKSRVYSVEVMIPNPHDRLKSGMIASLNVGGPTLSRAALAIPLSSVIRDPQQPNGFAVLVADGSGDTVTARLRSVELGEAYGNMIAVSSGLSNGERVVTTGATLVKAGDQVRVIP